MTNGYSNLFDDEEKEIPAGPNSSFEPDFVGQMEKEEQQALRKKILGEIKSGIIKHEQNLCLYIFQLKAILLLPS